MKYVEAAKKLQSMSLDAISTEIHPYVPRLSADTDRIYFRKMVLWLVATSLEPTDLLS